MTDRPTQLLSAELRSILDDLHAADRGDLPKPLVRARLQRLADHIERIEADDDDEPATVTGQLDVMAAGLDPDQEIRARALELAIDAIADVGSHRHYSPLAVAAQFAEWIRSGWPRADGSDGVRPLPLDTHEEEIPDA